MMNIVSTASDLMQDFKTGYMTLSSPWSTFVSQVVGTAMGCVISPFVFWLFYKAFDDIGQPESAYPAPYATVCRNMALLAVKGISGLPKNCLSPCYGFFAAAIVINLIGDLSGKVSQYIPISTAMVIPFYMGPYFLVFIASCSECKRYSNTVNINSCVSSVIVIYMGMNYHMYCQNIFK
ncbi:probable metal-nicotianamine transporter YSL13 [Benincasa hispida]|uniref:probable metal-nicotianamine transporter YSL13 n=1 Tax=Benincasa hispida TaxID=102211 RepID=UPI0018FF410B|nr:probable metal-nicotianamine transporter YSL13 [Benincasa hispida]